MLLLEAVTPWRVVALLVAPVILSVQAFKPFVDIDVYWHVRLGEQVLRTHRVSGADGAWAYTLPGSRWTTTQWLSEVVLALAHDSGGWRGIALLRVLCAAATVSALAVAVLRGRRTAWAALVFVLALIAASAQFQERPLLASLLLSVWLAGVCTRVLVLEAAPRAAPLLALTWLWANLHGQWVVVPGCLTLLAVGQTLARLRDRRATSPRRLWVLALAAAASGAVTPYGPRLLLTPLTFHSATDRIVEWAPPEARFDPAPALSLVLEALAQPL